MKNNPTYNDFIQFNDDIINSISSSLSTKVSKEGDTINNFLNIQNPNFSITTTTEIDYNTNINFKDKDNYTSGYIKNNYESDGDVSIELAAIGLTTSNIIKVTIDPSGNKTYYISEPSAFREAIGMNYNITVSTNDLTNGASELNQNEIYFYVPIGN